MEISYYQRIHKKEVFSIQNITIDSMVRNYTSLQEAILGYLCNLKFQMVIHTTLNTTLIYYLELHSATTIYRVLCKTF